MSNQQDFDNVFKLQGFEFLICSSFILSNLSENKATTLTRERSLEAAAMVQLQVHMEFPHISNQETATDRQFLKC